MLSMPFDLTPIYLSFTIKQTKNLNNFFPTHPGAVGSCGWQRVNAPSAQMPHTWRQRPVGAGYKREQGAAVSLLCEGLGLHLSLEVEKC